MTKELELFKKWFGVDGTYSYSLCEVEISHESPITHFYLNGNLSYSKCTIEEYINVPTFSVLGMHNGKICLEFMVPREYWPEWEQYVKEIKGEVGIKDIASGTPCPKCNIPMAMPVLGQIIGGDPCYFCYEKEQNK